MEESGQWSPWLASVHFYPACVVLEKRALTAPNAIRNDAGVIRREPATTLRFGRTTDPAG